MRWRPDKLNIIGLGSSRCECVGCRLVLMGTKDNLAEQVTLHLMWKNPKTEWT
jgi:hypothetical protein